MTFAEIALVAGLRALWKAPDWGLKLLVFRAVLRSMREAKDLP
jgi:hypothetical protein